MPMLNRRPRRPGRRGVTLVEMLVVVALVILMMVILVQIFQSATGAMTASRTSTELDLVLRQIDAIIRSDLSGVTAKMTPPNDPKDKAGYFEYGENAPADAHGEDTDDYIAFTTKAPEGQTFSGRQTLFDSTPPPVGPQVKTITITSQVAEVIYFLRNGNLYRRVFLVAPDRAKSIITGQPALGGGYVTSMFGGSVNVSWQGLNDISCRPSGLTSLSSPIPNDLGDLTNRENRAFRPRFFNDFSDGGNGPADGVADDFNFDGLNDYYPTLYFNNSGGYAHTGVGWAPNGQVNESQMFTGNPRVDQGSPNAFDVYAFPFIFPEMYSVPETTYYNSSLLGALHSIQPSNGQLNHSPLIVGDSVSQPGKQTWWGFPTWRETMAGLNGSNIGWTDPYNFLNKGGSPHRQPPGLQALSTYALNFLTPLGYYPASGVTSLASFSDNAGAPPGGSLNFVAIPNTAAFPRASTRVWEDDLVLTNVRSFDIKAYDPNAGLYNGLTGKSHNGYFSAGYQDLGYGANPYLPNTSSPGSFLAGDYIGGPNGLAGPPQFNVPWQVVGGEPVGFGHEGRIPPLPTDYRYHPRRGNNVGDPNTGINRLNRVFDTWSTDYTNAPDTDLFLTGVSPPGQPPVYPSFPPPYPSPLRGIQIQIRVVDPRGERPKSLTIRHDFTDKLED